VFHDQAVGILEEDAPLSEIEPVSHLTVHQGGGHFREKKGEDRAGHLSPAARSPGKALNVLNDGTEEIDLPFDLLRRAVREFLTFVDRAEEALVPGTVAGEAKEETSRLAGRPDGTLLYCLHGRVAQE